MAVINDIAQVVVGQGGPTVLNTATSMTVTVVEAIPVGMVGVPIPAPFSVLEVQTPGIQGQKGDQNVYVQSGAPANPQVGWVWVKI